MLNSRTKIKNKIVNETKNKKKNLFLNIKKLKESKICIEICPAIILAKSRRDKLNGLIKYEIISKTTRKGTRALGTF